MVFDFCIVGHFLWGNQGRDDIGCPTETTLSTFRFRSYSVCCGVCRRRGLVVTERRYFEDRSTIAGQLFTITGIFAKVQKTNVLLLALEQVSALNF